MAKFIIDTTDNNISRSMLEMILEEHLDYNVYVKEVKSIDEEKLDEFADEHFGLYELTYDGVSREEHNIAYKAGYRKAKEE